MHSMHATQTRTTHTHTAYHLPHREWSDILHSYGDIQHLIGYHFTMSGTLKLCHLHQTSDIPVT